MSDDARRFALSDGRTAIFASDPDVGFYKNDAVIAVVEVKGGIDDAGVLERLGAAIKSLSRVKERRMPWP